jgi:hypothetical protein
MLSHILGTPHFHAVCVTFAATAAIEALVAIWAATSRLSWFWRALAVWAGVMALVPFRAYEPAAVFAISSPLTAALVRLQQRRSESWTRFTIRDLSLFMLIVGLSLAGAMHLAGQIQKPNAVNIALSAIALTAIGVTAAACVFSPRPRRAIVSLLLTIGLCSVAIPMLGSQPEVYDAWGALGVGFHPSFLARSVGVLVLFLGELALLLIVVLALIRSSRPAALRGLAVAAAVFIFPLAAVYWQMLWLSPLPPPFSTVPNHYDRLLEIAQRIKSLSTLPQTGVARDERAALIDEVVLLLQNANYVPHDPNPNPSRVSVDHYAETAQCFRDLGRALDSEASAAFTRGDRATALKLRLAEVRLGVMLQRGAEEPTYLLGRAVEGVALLRFLQLRSDFSSAEARQLIAELQRANDEREAPEISADRDRAVAERAYGWVFRLDNVLERAGLGGDIYPPFLHVANDRFQLVRMLQTDLAVRLFQSDYGELPKTLGDLVPGYLHEVPHDRHSNQPLRYRADGGDFTLYSVGQDGVDNGGKFTNSSTYYSGIDRGDHKHFGAGYDFDLDTLTRP